MMTHIGNATLAALQNAAKARAEYLRHLERAMMLDPDPEYRAQAKAEYLKLTAPRCEHCAGLGRVFVCRHWPRCHCTDGAIKNDCPGHSATCPECGGKGNSRLVASTSAA